MDQRRLDQVTRATTLAQRDHIEPIPCQRSDTGESFWLVPSRSDPQRYYVLFLKAGRIWCQCQQSLLGRICAHAAAVRLTLQPQQQNQAQIGKQAELETQKDSLQTRSHPGPSARERGVAEDQQHAAALRRERALLWTDEQPFSMWKS